MISWCVRKLFYIIFNISNLKKNKMYIIGIVGFFLKTKTNNYFKKKYWFFWKCSTFPNTVSILCCKKYTVFLIVLPIDILTLELHIDNILHLNKKSEIENRKSKIVYYTYSIFFQYWYVIFYLYKNTRILYTQWLL